MLRLVKLIVKMFVVLFSMLVAQESATADAHTEGIQRELVSSWLVKVQGETRTRTLNIIGAEKQSNDIWKLDATYGWSDANQTAVKVSLIAMTNAYKLEFITQSNNVVVAESSDLKVFAGTFKTASGVTKPITFERISAEALAKRVTAATGIQRTVETVWIPMQDRIDSPIPWNCGIVCVKMTYNSRISYRRRCHANYTNQ